ncbi:MAG: tRNA threonylcarbamoyladenosine biosynthesis protein TsaB [Bacteroides sp. SM23_62_1]|nr:MAG: tRNA threonylcarbamoyladenosine biosynthesis protein TsaB [Bacteroides sp. SM23_62_1]
MALILNIETSTVVCSVSLARDGELLGLKESRDDKSHSSLLTVFIEDVLSSCHSDINDLDAVAVSKGPGSYTGLRIGVSVAKGIAYGTGCRFIGINTLQSMAYAVANDMLYGTHSDNILLCPMIDARRMEVYAAFYTTSNQPFKDIRAEIIYSGSFSDILQDYIVWFFGNGSLKCRNVIHHPHARFLDNIEPSAKSMVKIAEKAYNDRHFEDVAYFEPFYLKDFIATIPRKNIFS